MSEKVEKHRDGQILTGDNSSVKMQVTVNDIKSEGDYSKCPVYI